MVFRSVSSNLEINERFNYFSLILPRLPLGRDTIDKVPNIMFNWSFGDIRAFTCIKYKIKLKIFLYSSYFWSF